MTAPTHDFESRASISLAVSRYLRAAQNFESVSREFNEACEGLRSKLVEPSRFVARVEFKHYLVTSDQERNFEVEELELI